MRLTTWNVNGIRNPFSYPPWNGCRTFTSMFDILASDIVVMQELKIQRKDLRDDMVLLDGWDAYFSLPKHKKGYAGVGIYTRNSTCAPVKAEEGLLGVLPSPSGVPYRELLEHESIGGYPSQLQIAELGIDPAALDAEGRCVVLEFPAFVLFGVYSPANSNGLRDDFRYGFLCALDCRIRNLVRSGQRVVLVGDLNVSRDERDTAGSAEDRRKAGISHEDYISAPNRRIFNQILIGGEVVGARDEGRDEGVLFDTTRAFHPDRQGMYTHWEQKINARPGNFGSRIDFVLVSAEMRTWIQNANIQDGLLGSDHCPVFADFHDTVSAEGVNRSLLDLINPPGTFQGGQRKKEWKVANVPAFSAKRMPEFDKRQSIKAMFATSKVKKEQSETSERSKDTTSPTKSERPLLLASVAPMAAGEDITAAVAPSSLKRKSSETPKKESIKSQKSEHQTSSIGGQQSLKGFFATQSDQKTQHQTQWEIDRMWINYRHLQDGHPPLSPTVSNLSEPGTPIPSTQSPPVQSPSRRHSPSPSPSQFTARLAANEQTQRSWGELFAKPPAPLCEGHDEPCTSLQTKKKGSNQGRSFWMCARPLGPSGEKEKGTEWRCRTFFWCSDWIGRKDAGDGA